jgi:GNAT superfamily N-acetyltransferase
VIEIDHIVVKQEYRRHGVGKALMEGVHQWAGEMELDRLELSVWNFNKDAQDFYRGLGYEPAFVRMWKLWS